MIKITNTETYGWQAAIRGMRNPMNSWEKSDSVFPLGDSPLCVGDNDSILMRKLCAAGNDHAKFMRMITVTADIVAPLYWWKEYDTYKVGTVANSCSTMHKIHEKEFVMQDFSWEHLQTSSLGIADSIEVLQYTIDTLNWYRDKYLETKDKTCWWQMIQLLPSSYNQRRTVQLNYAVLKNMYHSRKNHKLDEWREFCKWVEELPHSYLIVGDNNAE